MEPELLAAITRLRALLGAKYGTDYSYIVCGGGKVIAANTRERGVIPEHELNTGKYEIDNQHG